MTSVGVGARRGARNTDFDAAQALLDLQSNKKPEVREDQYRDDWQDVENKEDLEKAAKLILSCFISSDVSIPSNKTTRHGDFGLNNIHHPVIPKNFPTQSHKTKHNESSNITSRSLSRSFNKSSSYNGTSPLDVEINPKHSRKFERRNYNTRDAGTQTEEEYFNPNIQLMETTIRNLCDRIKALEAQIKTSNSESASRSIEEATFETLRRSFPSYEDDSDYDPDHEMTVNDAVDTADESNSRATEFDVSTYNDSYSLQTSNKVVYNGILTSHNTKSQDSVPIGDGHATVPSRLLKNINWNSYSSATRKLLTAVFSRRVLATHSLTGKPSPAFPNKPAKKRLDPALVNDIVQTVVERCRVPENVVRTSITTKCADESKMFRTRENNKKKRYNKKNRENVPPATSDSEFDD